MTLDARHTQRAAAQAIVAGGGEYVLLAKGHQPHLQASLAQVFEAPIEPTSTEPESPAAAPHPADRTAETLDQGQGRIERRCLVVSPVLPAPCDWPGLHQVFQLTRSVTYVKTERQRTEVVSGLTSLTALKAGPADLLNLTRGHWHIENKVHWVRAVTLEEDRAQVRSGRLLHVMATLRNTALGRLRLAGETKLAAAFRRVAALPREALRLIGLNPTTE